MRPKISDTALFIPQARRNWNRLWYKKGAPAMSLFLLVISTWLVLIVLGYRTRRTALTFNYMLAACHLILHLSLVILIYKTQLPVPMSIYQAWYKQTHVTNKWGTIGKRGIRKNLLQCYTSSRAAAQIVINKSRFDATSMTWASWTNTSRKEYKADASFLYHWRF